MPALSVYDYVALGTILATMVSLFALDWPKAYTLAVGILAVSFVQLIADWQTGEALGVPALALVADRTLAGEALAPDGLSRANGGGRHRRHGYGDPGRLVARAEPAARWKRKAWRRRRGGVHNTGTSPSCP